jgi:hypothetical protein
MHVDVTPREILLSDSRSQYVIESNMVTSTNGEQVCQLSAFNVKDKFENTPLSEDLKIDVFVEAMSSLIKQGIKIEIVYPSQLS